MSNDLSDFVYFEAKEKIHEINIQGRINFEKKKQDLVKKGKVKIEDAYEKKLKQKEVNYKIEHSQIINNSRNKKLIARNKCLIKLLNKTQLNLRKKIENDTKFYSNLLKKIIIEGLIKMMDTYVIIYCLKKDRDLIKSIKKDCIKEFNELMKKELNSTMEIKIKIDKEDFLKERDLINISEKKIEEIDAEDERKIKIGLDDSKKCFGGILIKNKEKTITLKNTLDIRTEMTFEAMLPEFRRSLFS